MQSHFRFTANIFTFFVLLAVLVASLSPFQTAYANGLCSPGTYFNGSSCVNADPGYYVSMPDSLTQTPCSPGYYQPLSGAISCNQSPAGSYVPTSAATSATPCPAGSTSAAAAVACYQTGPNFVVNDAADTDDSACDALPGTCTLREAINAANALAGTDTITFDATVFNPGTIILTSDLPAITTDMTITGLGEPNVIVDGANLYRPFNITGGAVSISSLTIAHGYAIYGGGMYSFNSSPTLTNVTFSSNTASSGGGGMMNDGSSPTLSSPTLTNVTFSDNSAVFGGGLETNGGNLSLTNVTFSGNSATNGGGMISAGSPMLTNVIFSSNSATAVGGGLATNGNPTLTNVIFSSNLAGDKGGGIVNVGNPTLTNVTFSGNSAGNGGGMYNATNSAPQIRNSIFWGNIGSEIFNNSSTSTVSNSLVQGSGGSAAWNSSFGTDGGNNLDADPQFVTPITAPAPTTTGDLHLKTGSPAINAGNNGVSSPALPATDLDGNTRIKHGIVDIGAYEANYAPDFVVDRTDDLTIAACTSSANDCSLRGAINLANALSGADTITFDASLTGNTITLLSTLPNISDDVSIDGSTLAQHVTINANGSSGHNAQVFLINAGKSVSLTDLDITGAYNTGSYGGAIVNNGITTITNSNIYGNHAQSNGGGIYNDGTLTVIGSSISESDATSGGGIASTTGTLSVINSTISGTVAYIQGGAITNSGTLNLVNSTLANVWTYNGHASLENYGNLNMSNTIIADVNLGTYCANWWNTTGSILTNVGNLIEGYSDSCRNTNVSPAGVSGPNVTLNVDPVLGALADNGGPTKTMALGAGSPAINAGDSSTCLAINNVDQRGITRPQGPACDIGAFEFFIPDFVVDTTSDADLQVCSSAANDCSLRGAINLANALNGADTITFASSLSGATITLTSALPAISEDVTIDGSALASQVTVSGADTYQVLSANDGIPLTLKSLQIVHGKSASNGGCLYVGGAATVTNVTVQYCESALDGGGAYFKSTSTVTDCAFDHNKSTNPDTAKAAVGGGAYFGDTATLTRVDFKNNTTVRGGAGAVFIASANLTDGTFDTNTAGFAGGGAYFGGDTTVTGTSFISNTVTTDRGGGAYFNGTTTTLSGVAFTTNHASVDRGGGAYFRNSVSSIKDTTFTGNTAANRGGGAYFNAGATLTNTNFDSNTGTVKGAGAYFAGVTATTGGHFTGNHCTGTCSGGGLYSNNALTVTNVTFSGNTTDGQGAAIYKDSTSLAKVTGSTFSANESVGGAADAGGIYNFNGTLTVQNSTFVGNIAGHFSGAIMNDSGILNLINSTFYNNTAFDIGGIGSWGDLTITNSTITNNGGILVGGLHNGYGGAAPVIKNTIISNNSGDNCAGNALSGSNNLANDATCGAAFTNSSSILLGTLGNYGGATQTLPLLPGSSAMDAGDSATCADGATVNNLDQRGVTRPSACDIGAFESQGFTLALSSGNNQSALINTAFANPLKVSITANSTGEPVNGGKVTFTAPSFGASTSSTTYTTSIASGAAALSVSANGVAGGPYTVAASAVGATPTINFSLTNTAPDINLKGNGISIADGDTTPAATDNTDFGSLNVTSGSVTHTFTIENLGTGNLSLSGSPKVVINGVNAADFSVTTQPASAVVPSGSTTFMVKFDPSAAGVRNANITIANSDGNENPYNFAIQGTGVMPEMNVQGNGVEIVDGDTMPAVTDFTDFGSLLYPGSSATSHAFTIQNLGTANLNLNGAPKVKITGANASDFSVTVQPASSISPSGSTTFTVKFDPSAAGVRTAMVTISNNDSNENPYNFAIQGVGLSPFGANLIKNPGFNLYSGKFLPYWNSANFEATDGADPTVKQEGTAALKIVGKTNVSKVLTQVPVGAAGLKGDILKFSFWVKGQALPAGGMCNAQIALFKGSAQILTKNIPCPLGTYDFQQRTISFAAPGDYTSAVVRISFKKDSGVVWFDAMSLVKQLAP